MPRGECLEVHSTGATPGRTTSCDLECSAALHISEEKMFFQDFEIYKYKIPFELPCVSMIGWIDSKHDYAKGDLSAEIINKLWRCTTTTTDSFNLHVNRVRGIHLCNFCGVEVRHSKSSTLLGISEIWIPHAKGWFASPSLIAHYIAEHGYMPPKPYVEAVESLDFDSEINSQKAFEEIVRPIMLERGGA